MCQAVQTDVPTADFSLLLHLGNYKDFAASTESSAGREGQTVFSP